MKKRKINTKKFMEFLQEEIETLRRNEKEFADRGDYGAAGDSRGMRLADEFYLHLLTEEEESELPDYIEVVEEEQE